MTLVRRVGVMMPNLERVWWGRLLTLTGAADLRSIMVVLRSLLTTQAVVLQWDRVWSAVVPVGAVLLAAGALTLAQQASLGFTGYGLTLLVLLMLGTRNTWGDILGPAEFRGQGMDDTTGDDTAPMP
ncbi:hypothetical protein [Deinococcus sonorensis]|uniref:Uncharacterized protein n=2 Tax=Deinococcus sonorensis TaxID=309891 RepID=A0AAU7U674_9DEIO